MIVNEDGTVDLFVWFTAKQGYIGTITSETPGTFGSDYIGPYRVRIKMPEEVWEVYTHKGYLEATIEDLRAAEEGGEGGE